MISFLHVTSVTHDQICTFLGKQYFLFKLVKYKFFVTLSPCLVEKFPNKTIVEVLGFCFLVNKTSKLGYNIWMYNDNLSKKFENLDEL